MQQSAKQATKSAQQTAQEVAPDLGKQISNILLPGIKLPWQKNGAPAQSQQVSALTCSTYMYRLHPRDVCIGPHSMPTRQADQQHLAAGYQAALAEEEVSSEQSEQSQQASPVRYTSKSQHIHAALTYITCM